MNEHVGLLIKELREARGLSKSRLGREASVSNAYIVQIEQGQRSPSEDVLRRLAYVLRVAPHKLLIPAGIIDASEVAFAESQFADYLKRCAAEGETIDEESRDRWFAQQLGMADNYGAFDPRDRNYGEFQDPMGIPSEQFWGWDTPLAIPPLEHWEALSPGDRLLLQRIANRLAKIEDPEDQ